jgi:hypothetical protein
MTDPLSHDDLGEVDEAELLEAERLARALDERAEPDASEDALGAAALLRVLNDGELRDERARLIEREVLDNVRARPPRRALVWSALSAALGLTALGLVLWFDQPERAFAELPEPSVELLSSQASALTGVPDGDYAAQMAAYRQRVWRSVRSGAEVNP